MDRITGSPVKFKPLEILNNANPTTARPASLKKRCAIIPRKAEVIPPTPNKPGAVPTAKVAIISAPDQKLPVLIAYNCIACVKPQGRKKVNAPTVAALRWLYSLSCFGLIPNFLLKLAGKEIAQLDKRGDSCVSCTPSSSITRPTPIVKAPNKVPDN